MIWWKFLHTPPEINFRLKWETPASSWVTENCPKEHPQAPTQTIHTGQTRTFLHITAFTRWTCPKEHAQSVCICMPGTRPEDRSGGTIPVIRAQLVWRAPLVWARSHYAIQCNSMGIYIQLLAHPPVFLRSKIYMRGAYHRENTVISATMQSSYLVQHKMPSYEPD